MPRVMAAMVVVSILAGVRHAAAQPIKRPAGATPTPPPAPVVAHNDKPAPDEVPGENDALYSCKERSGPIIVTFKAEADVKELLAWVLGFTCKKFLLDPRIVATGRKVTIISPGKMTAAEAYRVFLGALSSIGLTVVAQGSVLRVVEAATARKEALPILKQGMPDDIDQVVRYVFKPSYVAAEPIHQAWQAMKSDAGDVFTIGALVVVTDYASHVREMLAFARLVDVPGGRDSIYTLPVLHADATKLTEKINAILSQPPAGAASLAAPRAAAPGAEPPRAESAAVPSKLVVDERTNTILVASSEAGYQRVKALVERLDIALEIEGGSAIHVYPLGSAIAEELAKTLTQAISEGHAGKPTGGPPPLAPGAAAAPAGAALAPTSPTPAVDSLGAAIEGQVRVIADPPTNSLIVVSSGRDFLAVKDVIKQLDLPRRQVYIEATILEVNLDNDRTTGAAGHFGDSLTDSGGPLLLGGVETQDVNSAAVLSSLSKTGLIAGLVSPATTLLGMNIPSYAALFHAVINQSNSHILSTPSIIAVDNVEAKYKIGLTIPVSDGTTTIGVTAGSTPANLGNTHVTPTELPLILNIKPHISNDDLVLLEVKHEAKELVAMSDLGPSWTTRAFETRVVVRDQQTVVLGGLTQDKETHEVHKVPLLGDIPLLGYLFKEVTHGRHRTNLLVMLTPYIIKDQLDLQAIRERKSREHDELIRSFDDLDHMAYEPALDYARKRGLLEEINRSVLDVEQEVAARGVIIKPPGVEAGTVDPRPAEPLPSPAPAVGAAPAAVQVP